MDTESKQRAVQQARAEVVSKAYEKVNGIFSESEKLMLLRDIEFDRPATLKSGSSVAVYSFPETPKEKQKLILINEALAKSTEEVRNELFDEAREIWNNEVGEVNTLLKNILPRLRDVKE